MSDIPAALAPDPGTTVDVATGSKAELQAPTGAGSWTKNGQAFTPPGDFRVDPTPGADDVYTATDGQTTWMATVRWQPDAPADVDCKAGKGNVTVSWSAIPADSERRLTYYEVDLDPAPPAAQLPRRVLRGAGSLLSRRKFAIDGLPPDFYGASVKSVRVGEHGTVASAAVSAAPVEVLPGAGVRPLWARLLLLALFALVLAGAIWRLLDDPKSGDRVSLDEWALTVSALSVVAILFFVAALVRPVGLITGADSRISTSRVNVAIWTVVIAFGVTTLAAFAFGAQQYNIKNPCAEKATADNRAAKGLEVDGICVDGTAVEASALDLAHTFKEGLTPNYLVLLGAPFVALAGAAFIVNRQVGSGERQKVPSAGPARFTDALTNDDGSADLVDSQYLIFTSVLLFYFLTSFLPSPSVLPDLPWGLVGLTGVTAGSYLLNKSVSTNGLSVVGLASPSTARGGSNRILGRNFLPEGSAGLPNGGVSVTVDGRSVPVTSVSDTEIVFSIPSTLAPQTYNVQVTTAASVSAAAGPMTVT